MSATLAAVKGSISSLPRLLESLTRCLNNLLERFHHSLFLYVLASPTRFVPISEYMIPFALLLATLPLTAAALATDGFWGLGLQGSDDSSDEPGKRKDGTELGSWSDVSGAKGFRGVEACSGLSDQNTVLSAADAFVTSGSLLPGNWTKAVATVVSAHLGGAFLWQASPLLVDVGEAVSQQLQADRELTCVVIWGIAALTVLTSAVLAVSYGVRRDLPTSSEGPSSAGGLAQGKGGAGSQLVGRRRIEGSIQIRAEWVALKSVMLAAAGLALGALVNLDFPLALLSAVFLVPVCLLARPLRSFKHPADPAVKAQGSAASNGKIALEAEEGTGQREGGKRGDENRVKGDLIEEAEGSGDQSKEKGETVAPRDLDSGTQDEDRAPSMIALCRQVRAKFAEERRRRLEARAKSRAGRLKAGVKQWASWVLDRRRAVQNWVKGRLRKGERDGQRHSRKALVKQVLFLVGAFVASASPFLVLTWEQTEGPSLRLFVEKLSALSSGSIAMQWLVAGYLPTVALCSRIICSPPVTH
jgi:hypothetical protein